MTHLATLLIILLWPHSFTINDRKFKQWCSTILPISTTNMVWFGLWCLTPLSTIFQLYHGGQFYWRRTQPTCCKSLTNLITYCCIEYTSLWTGFELTTSVVIGTDCIGSCKSNYHTITTTTVPVQIWTIQW